MCAVQERVLGRAAGFRKGPAYAKAGAERYGWSADLEVRFITKLERDQVDGVHPLARATRTYLDICFFHPFDDGNARSAMLAFERTLFFADIGVSNFGPIVSLQRVAGDLDGYRDFLDLVTILATEHR